MNMALPFVDLGGLWHITYFVGLAIIFLHWQFEAWRGDPQMLPMRLLWCYAFLLALYTLEFPAIHYGPFTHSYMATAGQVACELLLIPIGALLCEDLALGALPFVVAFELFKVWSGHGGLMKAESFDIAFLAAAMPFLHWPACALILLTVFTHHAGTAMLVVMAMASILLFKRLSRAYSSKTIVSAAITIVFATGLALARHHAIGHSFEGLLSGQGRANEWRLAFSFWRKSWHWEVFGVGPGSYGWTNGMLHGFKPAYFLDIHSTWLNFLWEFGIVGLLLAVATWVWAVVLAWDDEKILAALFGVAAFGLTYHPLAYFPSAVLVAIVVKISYSRYSALARRCHYPRRARWPKFECHIPLAQELRQALAACLSAGLFALLRYRQVRTQVRADGYQYLKRKWKRLP